MLNRLWNKDRLLILLYAIIKGILVYKLYGIATDISYQLNVAESIFQGHGIHLLQFKDNTYFYSLYLSHPPLTSIIIAFFRFFTDSIITADLIFRLFLVLCESIILFKTLNLIYQNNRKALISLFLILSIYVGHIDRGFTGDYFSFILLLCLFFLTYRFYKKSLISDYYLILVVILLIPLSKYTALPFIIFPFSILFFLKKFRGFEISRLKLNVILFVSILALFEFIMEVKAIGLTQKVGSFNLNNLSYLTRIDYFWFHGGLNLDRIWKHVMWNIDSMFNFHLLYVHYGQILTLILVFLIIRKNVKVILTKDMFLFLIIPIILQCAYLIFLTLNTSPQIGKYGIDSKIWVPIEEARYYNYLTFILFLFFMIYLYQNKIRFFLLLGVLLIFNTFSYKNGIGFITIRNQFEKYKVNKMDNGVDSKLEARFKIIAP
jgi:hypothetical protein